jgi:6-phosphogluconolactonase
VQYGGFRIFILIEMVKMNMNSGKAMMLVLVFFLVLLTAGCGGLGELVGGEEYQVYFGTDAVDSQAGIYSSVLDMKTGQLSEVKLVGKATHTGFIAIDREGRFLYCTGEPEGFAGPKRRSICAFSIDQEDGGLTFLNSQSSEGEWPCYVEIDAERRNVLVANYVEGNCLVLPIGDNGYLKSASSVNQHYGSSVHPTRQKKAYTHSIVVDGSSRYAVAADLGTDKLMVYKYDAASGRLAANDPAYAEVKAGGGPRHVVFGPRQKYCYASLELSSEADVFSYDPECGKLTHFQTIGTIPKEFKSENTTAGICVTDDGRFLYISNRGHNSIAIFSIAADTGVLRRIGNESTRGDVPQAIKIDPTGNFIILTDKGSGNASVFRINRETGLLSYTGSTINIGRVSSVAFRAL